MEKKNHRVLINRWIVPIKSVSIYKDKCKMLKKMIENNVFENAAICDEIALTQEKLLIVREECKFLAMKLKDFESQSDTPAEVNSGMTVVKKVAPRKRASAAGVIIKPKRPTPRRPKRKRNTGENIQEPFRSGNVTIYNFGYVIYDTPFYYSDSVIYPAGYYATRSYAHFRNLFSKCTYHCKVINAGSSPRFEIMDHDKHFKVTGLSTDECHSHLVSLINKMLGAQNFIRANRNGDRFFGLTLPQVRFKLQSSKESKLCTGYVPIKSQFENYEAVMKAEDHPSLSFEGLHAHLNKIRLRR